MYDIISYSHPKPCSNSAERRPMPASSSQQQGEQDAVVEIDRCVCVLKRVVCRNLLHVSCYAWYFVPGMFCMSAVKTGKANVESYIAFDRNVFDRRGGAAEQYQQLQQYTSVHRVYQYTSKYTYRLYGLQPYSILGRQLSSQKTENNTGFPFILKPASGAVGTRSDGSFLFAAYTRKNVFFAHR